MTNFNLNIASIEGTWSSCRFNNMVRVGGDIMTSERFNYVLNTLKKWFGDAEYFWSDEKGNYVFLVDKRY